MEAVRGYIRELRMGRQISQTDLADAIGLSRQAFIDWEMGRTKDIKSGPLFKAVQYLHGAIEDVANLILNEDASVDDGRVLASAWLTKGEQQAIQNRLNSFTDEELQEAVMILEEMRRRPSAFQTVMQMLRGLRG